MRRIIGKKFKRKLIYGYGYPNIIKVLTRIGWSLAGAFAYRIEDQFGEPLHPISGYKLRRYYEEV